MPDRACVFAGVLVWRAITTQRYAAFLTSPQMDPGSADLHAFLAFPPLWSFDRGNRVDVRATLFRHHRVLSLTRVFRIVSLLGGNVRAFFCHGTFHKEHEEGERGGEDPEGEEAVEISECG